MAATKADIREWFKEGKEKGATHMIVAFDTYDYVDYPVYVMPGQNVRVAEKAHSGNMQRVMEVYNLNMDMEAQLNQTRAFNY